MVQKLANLKKKQRPNVSRISSGAAVLVGVDVVVVFVALERKRRRVYAHSHASTGSEKVIHSAARCTKMYMYISQAIFQKHTRHMVSCFNGHFLGWFSFDYSVNCL